MERPHKHCSTNEILSQKCLFCFFRRRGSVYRHLGFPTSLCWKRSCRLAIILKNKRSKAKAKAKQFNENELGYFNKIWSLKWNRGDWNWKFSLFSPWNGISSSAYRHLSHFWKVGKGFLSTESMTIFFRPQNYSSVLAFSNPFRLGRGSCFHLGKPPSCRKGGKEEQAKVN